MSENYCPYCGSKIKIGDEFCNSCGASIEGISEPKQNQTYSQPSTQQPVSYDPAPTHQYGASTQTIYPEPSKPSTNQMNDNIFGILALVLSIGGFIAVGLMPFASVPLFIVALILGIVGMKKATQKGFSIAGIVISSIGLIISVIFTIIFILALIYSQ